VAQLFSLGYANTMFRQIIRFATMTWLKAMTAFVVFFSGLLVVGAIFYGTLSLFTSWEPETKILVALIPAVIVFWIVDTLWDRIYRRK
jgi:hypothetical protein